MDSKVWTEESITELLNNNNKAVEKAIVAIYNRQTEDEKSASDTKHSNGVGFSGADAHTGSYYAKWILSGRNLTGNHLAKGRKIAIKYRGQLLTIIADKAEKPTSPTLPASEVTESEAMSGNGTYRAQEKGTCDTCNHVGEVTMFYHRGAPVLAQCKLCLKCE